jgi:hypothetical protein
VKFVQIRFCVYSTCSGLYLQHVPTKVFADTVMDAKVIMNYKLERIEKEAIMSYFNQSRERA